MFSIIPHNFGSTHGNLEGSEMCDVESSKPSRVSAATNIVQGAMSIAIEPAQLRGQPDVAQLSVGANGYGTLELDESCRSSWCEDIHWVRALRLSDDCHSYNIQLRLQPSQRPCSILNKNEPTPKLIVQAVRPVEIGQELLLWFSEDILAMLQIVFLTPANIQGQNRYVCTRCSAIYESPNPLKLHISLGCGQYSISALWKKLSNVLTENSERELPSKPSFNFHLNPEITQARQRCAMDLSLKGIRMVKDVNNTNPQKLIYRPYSTPSAFKPFQKAENDNQNDLPSTISFLHSWQLLPLPQDSVTTACNQVNPHDDDEAQIETLVSSLGKSKQGHMCLYCGKCYSRKYGLKIHIRTHTGYKPLKCKYCLRPFGDPSNLNKHVRLHAEGDTPYKCDLCGKILVRRRDLERHLKSRHVSEMHPGANIIEETSEVDVSDEEQEKPITVDK